jgi:hypothetical protein
MNSNFINGFAAELTKEGAASHPLLTSVTKGGTLLGRKVKGMMNRVMKGKNPRMKKTSSPLGAMPAQNRQLSDIEKRVIGGARNSPYRQHAKAKHGSGDGNAAFAGNQAPAFTADKKKGKIGNPTENPENFKKRK